MGLTSLRRYHTQEPEHVNAPGDVEAAEQAQAVDVVPKGNASRDEWETYARSIGAKDEDLQDLSRDEIRDKYGE